MALPDGLSNKMKVFQVGYIYDIFAYVLRLITHNFCRPLTSCPFFWKADLRIRFYLALRLDCVALALLALSTWSTQWDSPKRRP